MSAWQRIPAQVGSHSRSGSKFTGPGSGSKKGGTTHYRHTSTQCRLILFALPSPTQYDPFRPTVDPPNEAFASAHAHCSRRRLSSSTMSADPSALRHQARR
eukprot:6995648-Prymnesium_polylepis.1